MAGLVGVGGWNSSGMFIPPPAGTPDTPGAILAEKGLTGRPWDSVLLWDGGDGDLDRDFRSFFFFFFFLESSESEFELEEEAEECLRRFFFFFFSDLLSTFLSSSSNNFGLFLLSSFLGSSLSGASLGFPLRK